MLVDPAARNRCRATRRALCRAKRAAAPLPGDKSVASLALGGTPMDPGSVSRPPDELRRGHRLPPGRGRQGLPWSCSSHGECLQQRGGTDATPQLSPRERSFQGSSGKGFARVDWKSAPRTAPGHTHRSSHPIHARGLVPIPGQRGWGLAGSGFLRSFCRQKGRDILLRAAFKAHDLQRASECN